MMSVCTKPYLYLMRLAAHRCKDKGVAKISLASKLLFETRSTELN